jgi:hypothetical protein
MPSCCPPFIPLTAFADAQDTIVAIKRGGTTLTVTSLYPDQYPDMHFDTNPGQVRGVQTGGS